YPFIFFFFFSIIHFPVIHSLVHPLFFFFIFKNPFSCFPLAFPHFIHMFYFKKIQSPVITSLIHMLLKCFILKNPFFGYHLACPHVNIFFYFKKSILRLSPRLSTRYYIFLF